jgi:hypothetical protein
MKDRSAKLIQAIQKEDRDAFTTILEQAKLDEVRTVVFVFITGGQKKKCRGQMGIVFCKPSRVRQGNKRNVTLVCRWQQSN